MSRDITKLVKVSQLTTLFRGLVWVLYKFSPLAVEQEAKIKESIWLYLIYTT